MVVAYGAMIESSPHPFILEGAPRDLGRIDGDEVLETQVEVWNVRRQHLLLEVVLSGCGCDDRSRQIIEVQPFSRRPFTIVTDPSHLAVGKHIATVQFRGLIGDVPFNSNHEYQFTVHREIND
ncbi:MAG: hypothetical protein H3C58_01850 [Fimbriimonadaceae bacterium]|nr:hypothetical protein [Fimbriimonadaceae bacterium]